jgi:hypothetical protein
MRSLAGDVLQARDLSRPYRFNNLEEFMNTSTSGMI